MINRDLLIKVIDILKEKNLTIGAVESFTGGLFSSTLTSVSGVSKVFKGFRRLRIKGSFKLASI